MLSSGRTPSLDLDLDGQFDARRIPLRSRISIGLTIRTGEPKAPISMSTRTGNLLSIICSI